MPWLRCHGRRARDPNWVSDPYGSLNSPLLRLSGVGDYVAWSDLERVKVVLMQVLPTR